MEVYVFVSLTARRRERFFVESPSYFTEFREIEVTHMKQIHVSDITLKKLAAARDVSLLFREKTAIAACADSLGADAVELAPIKSLREDTIIYKTIAKNIRNAYTEPSTSGIDKNNSNVALYIGCLTMP